MWMMMNEQGRLMALGTKEDVDRTAKEYMKNVELVNTLKKQHFEETEARIKDSIS